MIRGRGRRAVWWALGACATAALVLGVLGFHRPVSGRSNGADGIPVRPAAQPARTFAPDWVAAENAKAGTRSWRLASGKPSADIEGYADQTSVLPGARVGLYVDTTAARWRVTAYRIGWYHATGARQVWASSWREAQRQAPSQVSRVMRTVTAPWHRSLQVSTAGWPVGSYLLKLHSSRGAENYVPLTVRSRTFRGASVYMSEDMTWQAYNLWGGHSLYLGPSGSIDRSSEVSFDRPYDANFIVRFLRYEQPLILRAERLGLPMAYLTDIDVATRAGVLDGAHDLIVPGHDEYWTWNERRAVLAARDQGMNIAEFGGNAQYWQVRLAASSSGSVRGVIGYKSHLDPIRRTDPERMTIRWRDLPTPQPESALFGLTYACFPARGSYIVESPEFFAFRGTGAHRGSRYPGLIGEVDAAIATASTPSSLQVLTHSPITCGSQRAYSDSSYFVAPSHAGVFAAGTTGWVGLLNGVGRTPGASDATVDFVRTVTDNVLFTFASGPAGFAHPAVPNLAAVKG